MPNKDGTANVKDAIKSILIGLALALLIVWTGTSLPSGWLIVVTPACTGAGGWMVAHSYNKNVNDWQVVGIWAGIGLLAGFLLHLAV